MNISWLKIRARKLKAEITAVYYAYRHPSLGWFPKIIIVITIGYALSPIDLIPDFIPIIGYLDDLIILPALISLSVKLIPAEIMSECRSRAKAEPLSLKKNWIVATVFILVWLLMIFLIVKRILDNSMMKI